MSVKVPGSGQKKSAATPSTNPALGLFGKIGIRVEENQVIQGVQEGAGQITPYTGIAQNALLVAVSPNALEYEQILGLTAPEDLSYTGTDRNGDDYVVAKFWFYIPQLDRFVTMRVLCYNAPDVLEDTEGRMLIRVMNNYGHYRQWPFPANELATKFSLNENMAWFKTGKSYIELCKEYGITNYGDIANPNEDTGFRVPNKGEILFNHILMQDFNFISKEEQPEGGSWLLTAQTEERDGWNELMSGELFRKLNGEVFKTLTVDPLNSLTGGRENWHTVLDHYNNPDVTPPQGVSLLLLVKQGENGNVYQNVAENPDFIGPQARFNRRALSQYAKSAQAKGSPMFGGAAWSYELKEFKAESINLSNTEEEATPPSSSFF